jgi:hypothetical protein
MINLTEFMAIICPQQKINRSSAVAWYEVIGHLDFTVACNAVIAVKHSQAFVDPSDIIREAEHAQRRHAHPSERIPAEAVTASTGRELAAAQAVPPTDEYLAAKAEMDARMRERAEQVMLSDREAERRANDWLRYKLTGKLPPELAPLGSPVPPRWVQLPGDPPELREWLVRQAQAAEGLWTAVPAGAAASACCGHALSTASGSPSTRIPTRTATRRPTGTAPGHASRASCGKAKSRTGTSAGTCRTSPHAGAPSALRPRRRCRPT